RGSDGGKRVPPLVVLRRPAAPLRRPARGAHGGPQHLARDRGWNMAGAAQDATEASVRVLNAKARLVELAIEAEAAPGPVERAADAVRAHPWRGVAIALVAGALLGAAPRRSAGVARPLLTPLMGLATDLAL